jgi:ribosomal protein S18 acetylase RimI-like enzyme
MNTGVLSLRRRDAHSTDAETIVRWFSTKAEAISWGGPNVPEPLTVLWLAQQFEAGRYWVWVDNKDSAKAIFGLLFPEEELAHLTRFGIAPDLRGRGLAKRLVGEIADVARSFGARRLSLRVYGSNAVARHVYDTLGFQVIEQIAVQEDPSGLSVRMSINL